MAKLQKRTDIDGKQLSLFDLVKQQHQERTQLEPQTGTLNITLQQRWEGNKAHMEKMREMRWVKKMEAEQ
jgi:CTP-dependent riboflavin kinase